MSAHGRRYTTGGRSAAMPLMGLALSFYGSRGKSTDAPSLCGQVHNLRAISYDRPPAIPILLNIMAGRDLLDPHTKDVAVPDYLTALTGDIRGVRLGVPTNYFSEDVQPEVANAVAEAIVHLESLGAKVVPIEVPALDGVLDCFLAIAMSEAAAYHQSSLRKTPELFGDETRLLLEAGEMTPATTYINAQRARVAIKAGFRQALRKVDVLSRQRNLRRRSG